MRERYRRDYIRFCSFATVKDIYVAFLVFKGNVDGERISLKQSISAKYAGFVGGKIVQQSGVRVIDEKGNQVKIESIQLNDYIEDMNVTWALYECKFRKLKYYFK